MRREVIKKCHEVWGEEIEKEDTQGDKFELDYRQVVLQGLETPERINEIKSKSNRCVGQCIQ